MRLKSGSKQWERSGEMWWDILIAWVRDGCQVEIAADNDLLGMHPIAEILSVIA